MVSCVSLITSCSKDKDSDPPLPGEMNRLAGIEFKSQASIYQYSLEYDATGRINRITYQSQQEPRTTVYNVSYSGNSIQLARPAFRSSALDIYDTIRLTMDGYYNILERVQFRFVETKAPDNIPGKTYVFDTTRFEYSYSGMLLGVTRNKLDTSWSKGSGPDGEVRNANRLNEVANYILEGNKLVGLSSNSDVSKVIYKNSEVTTNLSDEELTIAFEYSKSYPNKTDFSNCAVLNELHLFATDMPFNKTYSVLPDKVNRVRTIKKKDGTVISTTNQTANLEFTFNSDGFLLTKRDPSNPSTQITYWYGR